MHAKQHGSAGCFNGNSTMTGHGHPYNFKGGFKWGMHEAANQTSNDYGFACGAGTAEGFGEPDGMSCGSGYGCGVGDTFGQGFD